MLQADAGRWGSGGVGGADIPRCLKWHACQGKSEAFMEAAQSAGGAWAGAAGHYPLRALHHHCGLLSIPQPCFQRLGGSSSGLDDEGHS